MEDKRFLTTLGDDELKAYLQEIDEDEIVDREFYQSHEDKLPPKERTVFINEMERKRNENNYVTPEAYALNNIKKAAQIANKREEARKVKQSYVMNGRIDELSEVIDVSIKRAMVAIMTESIHRDTLITHKKITEIIEKELRRFIPINLKSLYRINKLAFTPHPGFEYVTSQYYGSARVFIKPDIPHIFAKGPTEMEILRAKCTRQLFNIDKLVEKYYLQVKRRLREEVRIANKLKQTKTLLDIINTGIYYYDAYIVAKEQLK